MGVQRLWREANTWRQAGLAACMGTALLVFGPPACSGSTATSSAPTIASNGSYSSVPSAASTATNVPSNLQPGSTGGITVIPSPSAPVPPPPPPPPPPPLKIAPNPKLEGLAIRQKTKPESPSDASPDTGFATIRPTHDRSLTDTIKPRETP